MLGVQLDLLFAGLVLLCTGEQRGGCLFVSYQTFQAISSFSSALGLNQELFMLMFKKRKSTICLAQLTLRLKPGSLIP